jgi:hypothetical protein
MKLAQFSYFRKRLMVLLIPLFFIALAFGIQFALGYQPGPGEDPSYDPCLSEGYRPTDPCDPIP